jgi:hypothetical protein
MNLIYPKLHQEISLPLMSHLLWTNAKELLKIISKRVSKCLDLGQEMKVLKPVFILEDRCIIRQYPAGFISVFGRMSPI